jgi:SAM-dependent methyltransferase
MSLNYSKEYNSEIREWIKSVFEMALKISQSQLEKRFCPVCHNDEQDFYANNDYLDYSKCRICSLVYMNPAPGKEAINEGFQGEDELLMRYFEIMSKYKSNIPEKTDPLSDNKLKDIFQIKQEGKLLDVGCSLGDFLHKAKHYYTVEGLEVNPLTAPIAERYFKVYRDFLENLNLPQVYDIVTLNQILYGLPEPISLLKEINKILKPGGLLYINSPNSDSYATQLFKGKVNHLYGYTSLNVFNKKSLEVLAEKSGFKIKTFRTEWYDIYQKDIQEFLMNPREFIHKRNSHLGNYEELISIEDEFFKNNFNDLGENGHYLVAVLEKNE